MNIRPDDFVLEIGSGHNPKIRSDILCDKFIDDDLQRGGSIISDRPLVEADGQSLPFADASFDYVICSHILEHVEDPERFLSELARVASAGYIETPSEIAEKLYGWPYHNWMVNLFENRLIIQEKTIESQFGQLFHALAENDKYFSRFHLTHHKLFLVQYEWAGKIDYEIIPVHASTLDLESRETTERILNEVNSRSIWEKLVPMVKGAIPRDLVFKAKSLFAKQRPEPAKVLKDILVCPICKGTLTWRTDWVCCQHCKIDYPIIDNIPRMHTMPPESKKKDYAQN